MRGFVVGVAGLFLLMLVAPALAQDCAPSTSRAVVTSGGFYVAQSCAVDVPACEQLCGVPFAVVLGLCSVWIYEESNGIDGLQRSDERVDDTCGGAIEADTLVF